MRNASIFLALIAGTLSITPPTRAQEGRADDTAMTLARQWSKEFSERFNAHDAAGVAAFYAPDADRATIVQGELTRRVRGRSEIEKYYSDAFTASPRIEAELTPDSARQVAPGVIVIDGSFEVRNATTGPSRGRFVSVRRNQDGKWQTVCARVITPSLPSESK